jgi:hypothetical protein
VRQGRAEEEAGGGGEAVKLCCFWRCCMAINDFIETDKHYQKKQDE